ncbi:MAG: 4a-hydroxytetrahydrobiopterin dehydratase [Anaerolineae bacterium]
MNTLASETCVACRGDEPPLSAEQIAALQLHIPEWRLIEKDGIPRLERIFKFKNFIEAVAFTNKVALIAEKEDHHPLMILEWGRVTVQWWTHKLKGLHMNDFIMAARTDLL